MVKRLSLHIPLSGISIISAKISVMQKNTLCLWKIQLYRCELDYYILLPRKFEVNQSTSARSC